VVEVQAQDLEVNWPSRRSCSSSLTVSLVAAGGNPVVFFDITIGGHNAGRIKIELFADEVPK